MVDSVAEAAVLLVAHGSRVAESNAEIETLALRLAANLPAGYAVSHAFLELASPSIGDALDTLAEDGITRVLVVPYFLAAGRHVTEDIPAIVEAARKRHPHLEARVTGHLGAEEGVPALLSAMVTGAADG